MNYIHYLAYRPHVEKVGTHGLFSGYDEPVVLNKVAQEVAAHEGKVWTAVFSLKREDAQRLGYDNARRWQDLLNANASLIAEKMHIQPTNFKWYAAFHDEGDHPHVHFVAYAEEPGNEYLTPNCVVQIRSALARQIFKDELQQIYEQQTVVRNTLAEQAESRFQDALAALHSDVGHNPSVEKLLLVLLEQLKTTKGKKVYGYLPSKTKALVDQIVDALAEDEKVAAAYAAWGELRQQVFGTYMDEEQPLPPLSQQPEFKKIRNMVVQAVWESTLQPVDDAELPEPKLPVNEVPTNVAIGDEKDGCHAAGDTWWSEKFLAAHRMLYEPAPTPEELQNATGPEEIEEGVRWLTQSATGGNNSAQYLLGRLYLAGEIVAQNRILAMRYLSQAAQGGNNFATYKLATIMLNKEDEFYAPARAIPLLEQAAKDKNEFAEYRLGKLLMAGGYIDKDTIRALKLLHHAADKKENLYAQYYLGKTYLYGMDAPQDIEKGEKYLQASAAQGNEYAQYLLDHWAELQLSQFSLTLTKLLRQLEQLFQEQQPRMRGSHGTIDRKRLRQLRQKKIALGHAEGDMELKL